MIIESLSEVVQSQTVELKKLWKNKRNLLFQGLNLAMIVFSALMIWKGLMFITKSGMNILFEFSFLFFFSDKYFYV